MTNTIQYSRKPSAQDFEATSTEIQFMEQIGWIEMTEYGDFHGRIYRLTDEAIVTGGDADPRVAFEEAKKDFPDVWAASLINGSKARMEKYNAVPDLPAHAVIVGNPVDGFSVYASDTDEFDRDLFDEWWITDLRPMPTEADPVLQVATVEPEPEPEPDRTMEFTLSNHDHVPLSLLFSHLVEIRTNTAYQGDLYHDAMFLHEHIAKLWENDGSQSGDTKSIQWYWSCRDTGSDSGLNLDDIPKMNGSTIYRIVLSRDIEFHSGMWKVKFIPLDR